MGTPGTDPGRRVRPASGFLASFRYAGAGIRTAWLSQRNVRVQLAIGLAVIVLGAWLGLDALRWAVLVLTMGLVLGLEMANSAIEALGDAVSAEDHPLVGQAKDAAAGAVLLVALVAVVVGLLVLGPPLWQRLFGATY